MQLQQKDGDMTDLMFYYFFKFHADACVVDARDKSVGVNPWLRNSKVVPFYDFGLADMHMEQIKRLLVEPCQYLVINAPYGRFNVFTCAIMLH